MHEDYKLNYGLWEIYGRIQTVLLSFVEELHRCNVKKCFQTPEFSVYGYCTRCTHQERESE